MQEFLRLKKSNCRNCYKCIRHCSVKSIRFSGNQAHIVGDECVLCGNCFVICPQNAREIRNDVEKAKVLLASGSPVVASLAPSFSANYEGCGIEDMRRALKKLGFADAEETALGATYVKNEYESIMASGMRQVCISSCCPSVNLLIRRYYPEALKYLARVVSPMQAHCADIRARCNNAKTVFIGPCIAKKQEADEYGDVDCVLTFAELSRWLQEAGIEIEHTGAERIEHSHTRIFPTDGGVIGSMTNKLSDCRYVSVSGPDNCINALKDISRGRLSKCFIEMSMCSGSCIGGPAMDKSHQGAVHEFLTVTDSAGDNDFIVGKKPEMDKAHPYTGVETQMPGNDAVREILRQMGKTKPEDELNCGSCGYNTCREKAVAVYQGKADLTMCMPYLRDKAESFSDNIINNTPNGILVMNEQLEVQQINKAAMRIMNIPDGCSVLGEPVVRLLDPLDFLSVLNTGKSIRDKRVYLADYKKYVEETVIMDHSFHIIMCIMRDITMQEQERQKKEELGRQTVEITDKVVDKQMRVVQEIASLLGETAAETKIALTKLKESLRDE